MPADFAALVAKNPRLNSLWGLLADETHMHGPTDLAALKALAAELWEAGPDEPKVRGLLGKLPEHVPAEKADRLVPDVLRMTRR